MSAYTLPMDDYFTSSYEPHQLVDEWMTLTQQLNGEVNPTGEEGRPVPVVPAWARKGSSPAALGPESSASRQPRSSLALDALYDQKRLLSIGADHVSAGDEDDVGDGSSTTSSEGSAYKRHHRYDHAATAYQHMSDPYDCAREAERQERFIDESKRLGRPFVPGGRGGLEKPTRLLLGDCVRSLYRSVSADWPEAEVLVVTTAEDLIAIYFSLHNLKKKQAALVLRYMNRALKCNPSIHQFSLAKVPEGWDILTNDGNLLYTLRPPWVKKRLFLPDTIRPEVAHEQ